MSEKAMAPHSSTLAWKIPWTEGLVGCSRVRLFETPWTIAGQAPLSMEFSRQEYWSGLPFPSPEDLPDQGSNLGLPHCKHILTKRGGSKVKHFLVSVHLQRGCVNFYLSVVIHRWAWSRCSLWATQKYFNLMLITWEAGFPEMGHYV